MTELVRYEAMCRAIAEAHSLDEILPIRDRAAQIAAAAKIAKNLEAESKCREIRVRAERRAGELTREIPAAQGQRGDLVARRDKVPKEKVLAGLGISKHEASQWERLAAVPSAEFEAALSGGKPSSRGILDQTIKKAARSEREAELAAKQAALPDKRYGVIYADPPWRFEPWSRETGMDRAADNHYPTSYGDTIADLDVTQICADDCAIFLWATSPMLPQAICLIDAWGFDYRSHFIWAKDRIGTGYWNRNKHELLLIGVRGDIPAPAMGTQWPSLIEAPVGKHSAKPERFLEMIESYFPSLPKIELYRRGPVRLGWDAWGNEAEAAG